MVEAVGHPSTLSVIRKFRPHSDLQGIRAEYYNLTDLQGAPLAGLLVLMDRRSRPVRAEIHLHHTADDSLYRIGLQQAQRLISDRYSSDRPVPLYPLRVELDSEPLAIQAHGSGRAAASPPGVTAGTPLIIIIGLVLAVSALLSGWFLNAWLSGDLADSGGPTALSSQPSTANIPEGVLIAETNELPASQNAIPMKVGDRVRLLPEYKISLRTEAGPQEGAIVADLQDAVQMTITNGPVWLQGQSDTIVYWYVRLDDGTEGWVPANTSDLTLLEPVFQDASP